MNISNLFLGLAEYAAISMEGVKSAVLIMLMPFI
jgi:hypothetical protein